MKKNNPLVAGFPISVLMEAGMCIVADMYWSALEAAGVSCPTRDITKSAPKLKTADKLVVVGEMAVLLGRIEQAWGHSVFLVFHHAGITGDQAPRALMYLALGCLGHGTNLADDYEEHLKQAARILKRNDPEGTFDPSPINTEMYWLAIMVDGYAIAELDRRGLAPAE